LPHIILSVRPEFAKDAFSRFLHALAGMTARFQAQGSLLREIVEALPVLLSEHPCYVCG
jgi:hypothetical protein